MQAAPLRVASVPAGHVYVRHLSDPDGQDRVVRLQDPPVPGAPSGQWWPSPMLDPGWVRDHAHEFDVLHIHFGFDDRSASQLQALVETLRAVVRPMVVTVHDLRNPHHPAPGAHEAALEVLVAGAAEVITLTDGAAGEIWRRWGRRARVIPHPHVVGVERMGRQRAPGSGFAVGLHAKSERANNDSVTVSRALAEVVDDLPGATLRIDVHDDERGRAVAAALGGLDVRVHRRFSDEQLWDYLSGLDASVLPYRFGTHSGWMEACRDLGTTVIAPSCGHYGDQGPCVLFDHDESGLDRGSLAKAVRDVFDNRPDHRVEPATRLAQRRQIARAHRQVYESVVDRRSAGST